MNLLPDQTEWHNINSAHKCNACVRDICAWSCMHACACLSFSECLAAFLHVWMWLWLWLCVAVSVCACVCRFGVSKNAAVAPAARAVKPALYPLLFPSLVLICPCQGVCISLLHSLTLVIPIFALHQIQGPNPSLCESSHCSELL